MKHEIPKKATLRNELVLCGKKGCAKLHGPYWYAYWQQGARTRKVYIGKKLPDEVRARRLAPSKRKRGSAHDPRLVEELTLDDEGGEELLDAVPSPAARRASRPAKRDHEMTDMCECDHDYGTHDGTGPCAGCDCTRFKLATPASLEARGLHGAARAARSATARSSERKVYKLTRPQWDVLKELALHELGGADTDALVNNLKARHLVELELIETIDRGQGKTDPEVGYGRLVVAKLTEIGKRVYSRLSIGPWCSTCRRPMAFMKAVHVGPGVIECTECNRRTSATPA